MRAVRRLGVFGGTFDPVHVGHLIIAEILRHRLLLDHVTFLPAGRPPHKPDRELASDRDRVGMLDLAIANSPHFSISTIDLERPGPSYTAESLAFMQHDLGPDCELYLLMGQDSLRDFPNWHRPGDIARIARLGVALRPDVNVSIDEVEQAVPETRDRIHLVNVPLIGISSSEIRMNVSQRGPYRFQVLPAVADYIEAHQLYEQPKIE